MMTAHVSDEIYKGAGWAVVAIRDDQVITAIYIDHPDSADLRSVVEQIKQDPTFVEAAAASDAAYEEAQQADDIEAAEDEWCDKYAVDIRVGMMGSFEFSHSFTKAERRKVGVAALI